MDTGAIMTPDTILTEPTPKTQCKYIAAGCGEEGQALLMLPESLQAGSGNRGTVGADATHGYLKEGPRQTGGD